MCACLRVFECVGGGGLAHVCAYTVDLPEWPCCRLTNILGEYPASWPGIAQWTFTEFEQHDAGKEDEWMNLICYLLFVCLSDVAVSDNQRHTDNKTRQPKEIHLLWLTSPYLVKFYKQYLDLITTRFEKLSRNLLIEWCKQKIVEKAKCHIPIRRTSKRESHHCLSAWKTLQSYFWGFETLWTTVRVILNKCRNMSEWWDFPCGRSSKITSWRHWGLFSKEPRAAFKAQQAFLAFVEVSHHDSTMRKKLGKYGIDGMIPKTLGKIFSGPTTRIGTFENLFVLLHRIS